MNNHAEAGRRLLAGALELDVAAVDANASIDTLEPWDSLAHMRLILTIEEHLQRTLGPEEIANIFSLQDIAQLLGRHNGPG